MQHLKKTQQQSQKTFVVLKLFLQKSLTARRASIGAAPRHIHLWAIGCRYS